MSLLKITNLSHSFEDKILFNQADVLLNKGEHIGITGPNGAGKSTLLKICTGQILPDAGSIIWQPGVTIGYLDQYAQMDERITAGEFLKTAFRHLYEVERRMNHLYEQAVQGDISVLEQAAKYQARLELSGFYNIDTKIGQVAEGMGLYSIGLERPIGQMSGGQRAKVILSKLLLENPDVLLLDEPTNFLDKEHVAWLSDYLMNIDKAFMVISHDTDFLEKIADRICDIEFQSIRKYHGNYSEFLSKKAFLHANYIRQYTAQQKEIKKTEEFIRKNIAGRKSKMARGRQKQLDRMNKMEALEQKEIKPVFCFTELPVPAKEHLVVKSLSVGYGNPILSGLDFVVKSGQKVVITGFNGIGKSTLLKTLAGQIQPLGGSFNFAEKTAIGYFAQDFLWKDDTQTPLQVVAGTFAGLRNQEVRRQLSRSGISSTLATQQIKSLSGGEQAKVCLCLLTWKPSNFLILDEPTNHLDIQAKDSLRKALEEFTGTILLVSHEEAFYRDWAHDIINIQGLYEEFSVMTSQKKSIII